MSSKIYDVVVWGATGFTGRLVSRYLAVRAPSNVRWAIAGRSEPTLRALEASIKKASPRATFGVLVGAANASGVIDYAPITSATKVIVSTAGPFALCGEGLVVSCIENAADYCDITGESPWVDMMIRKHGDRARAAGVTLVSMCGFDSIPADVGSLFLVSSIRTRWPGAEVSNICSYVNMAGGGRRGAP